MELHRVRSKTGKVLVIALTIILCLAWMSWRSDAAVQQQQAVQLMPDDPVVVHKQVKAFKRDKLGRSQHAGQAAPNAFERKAKRAYRKWQSHHKQQAAALPALLLSDKQLAARPEIGDPSLNARQWWRAMNSAQRICMPFHRYQVTSVHYGCHPPTFSAKQIRGLSRADDVYVTCSGLALIAGLGGAFAGGPVGAVVAFGIGGAGCLWSEFRQAKH